MLTEERYSIILNYLAEKKVATIAELTALLDSSDSTVRRDLHALNRMGKLCKVHGGATAVENNYLSREDDVLAKKGMYIYEKKLVAKHAASLIEPEDFVYLDAGTTTLQMIDYMTENRATYVTNGIQHAARLTAKGFNTYILGGRLKATTEAVIGTEAIRHLSFTNFNKGFFGSNGISIKAGFATVDFSEANVKREAFSRCRQRYVLADSSKFKRIFPVSFAKLEDATIITDMLTDPKYRELTTVIEVNS